MADSILTARTSNGAVTLVAAVTTDLVREAQERHALAPTASAAVGRLVTGAALFGAGLKGRERVTLQVAGDGPIGGITADAWLLDDDAIAARGYAQRPNADVPLNERGKFDVARVVGRGKLQVTRSYEVGQPYNGIVPLVSGEIGEDLAAYLVYSEQIPSVVALGVLAAPEGIRAAGGVIAQLAPGAAEGTIAALEANALAMPAVTAQIASGASPEELISNLVGELEWKAGRRHALRFDCRCTREKVEVALMGLGRDELEKLAREQAETEATCDFCRRRYALSSEDVRTLVERIDAANEATGR